MALVVSVVACGLGTGCKLLDDRPAAYDAHYLALAEMAGCPFWTADERLYDRVHAELDWVHRLRDYQSSGISG